MKWQQGTPSHVQCRHKITIKMNWVRLQSGFFKSHHKGPRQSLLSHWHKIQKTTTQMCIIQTINYIARFAVRNLSYLISGDNIFQSDMGIRWIQLVWDVKKLYGNVKMRMGWTHANYTRIFYTPPDIIHTERQIPDIRRCNSSGKKSIFCSHREDMPCLRECTPPPPPPPPHPHTPTHTPNPNPTPPPPPTPTPGSCVIRRGFE